MLAFVVGRPPGCNPADFKTEAASSTATWYPLSLPIQNLNLVLSQESPNVFGPTYEGLITEDGVGIFSQP